MPRFRYSRWTHSAPGTPAADQVFEQFNDYLNDTGDIQQALRRLMQRGLKSEEHQMAGLDEILSRIAREIRRLYENYRLRPSLDQVQEQLRSILEREKQALEAGRAERPQLEEKEKFLDRLPERLSDAVQKLASYEFEDPQAGSDFQNLLSQLDQIRRLENYLRREGSLFRGQTPLDFQGAQEMMDRMEGLRRLEAQISSGRLEDMNLDLLETLLGSDAREDLAGIARLESILEDGGYIASRGDRYELTPRAVRKIGQLALHDIYLQLSREGMGRHPMHARGSQERKTEESRPYVEGDPLDLDMIQTLKNSLRHDVGLPLKLDPKDFAVYAADHTTRASTVLLLDMSWSMSWDGRFAAAKKVALAMGTLIRAQYPRDYFGIVGFFTRAVELKAKDLPEATWNMGDPFTNLQHGLHLASEMLGRRPSRNQQVIVITDGQPTAYFRHGRLYCEWPLSFGGISHRAAEETLREAERVTRLGITINTFMLDDSPMLKGFVDQMTRINKGRAFYTQPDRLGEYLLVDYVAHRRRKI